MVFGKKIFSKLDLRAAYNQIPVAPADIPNTAVITPFGLFEFKVMTFGLRNAAQSFQRYINEALKKLDFVFVYIDDILIASANLKEHKKHLRMVFERLRNFYLRLDVDKCSFAVTALEFLGYTVSVSGIKPVPEKVKAISDFPKPVTILELRRFFTHAAQTQSPLNSFLHVSKKND